MTAGPFFDFGCYEKVASNESIDFIGSSLCAWANAGSTSTPIVSTLVIGVIPILLAVMVYIRYQKIAPSIYVMFLTQVTLFAVEAYYDISLVSLWASGTILTLSTFGVALTFVGFFWNKQ